MAIVCAFYKGTRAENPRARLFDRVVTWWPRSRGRFSHCELVASREGLQAKCWSASSLDGSRVRAKEINLGTGRWVLVILQDLEAAPALTWFEGAEGRGYDYPGILGFVWRRIKQVRRWLFCSEAVASAIAAAARACNRPHLAPPDTNVSPSKLFAWCSAQPGARVIEVPNLERAHA